MICLSVYYLHLFFLVRTLVKRSISVDLSSICSGSTKNSLSPRITPPAAVSAFMPDDY